MPGGRLRVKIAGLIYTFTPQPADFTGWGIFQPVDEKYAQLLQLATLPQIDDYLQRLPKLRLFLVEQFNSQTWFGYPHNLAEAKQRFGITTAVPIHLVTEGNLFDTVIARPDGKTWWFDHLDRRADPRMADQLKQALTAVTRPEDLKLPKLTPELRTAYQLATQSVTDFTTYHQQQRQAIQARREQQYAEQRLRGALAMGGGELCAVQDRGDYWWVEWQTSQGGTHASAIAKPDLTVISAGICLSGRDSDFDLQALVGVVERAERCYDDCGLVVLR